MATISGRGTWIAKGVHQTVWPNMGNADVGSAQSAPMLPDKSFQIAGTYGGATIVIQGSNDGTNWETLRDPGGAALSFTVGPGLKQILENTKFIRPSTSGGAGTDLTVTLISRAGDAQ